MKNDYHQKLVMCLGIALCLHQLQVLPMQLIYASYNFGFSFKFLRHKMVLLGLISSLTIWKLMCVLFLCLSEVGHANVPFTSLMDAIKYPEVLTFLGSLT